MATITVQCNITAQQLDKIGIKWKGFSGARRALAEEQLENHLHNSILNTVYNEYKRSEEGDKIHSGKISYNNDSLDIKISISSPRSTAELEDLKNAMISTLRNAGFEASEYVSKNLTK